MRRPILLPLLLLLLAACGRSGSPWIYAQTPVPPPAERGGKPLVVTVGDSIAAGWMDCRGDPSPCAGIMFDWWQAAIGDWAIVRSRGIGSSTSADLLARWPQDTAGADIIIILTGVNDLAAGVSADDILGNFEQMHALATQAGAIPIFSTILPADTTQGEALRTMQTVNEALRTRANWLVIDLAAEMADPANPGYLRRNEIAHPGSSHPNAAGYARMVAAVRAWWQQNQSHLTPDVGHSSG